MARGYRRKLNTFGTRKFYGRYEIAVTCYQNQDINLLLQGKGGYIQSNPHIYTLLLKGRAEVVGSDLMLLLFVWQVLLIQFPAPETYFSHAKSEVIYGLQLLVKFAIMDGERVTREIPWSTIQGPILRL